MASGKCSSLVAQRLPIAGENSPYHKESGHGVLPCEAPKKLWGEWSATRRMAARRRLGPRDRHYCREIPFPPPKGPEVPIWKWPDRIRMAAYPETALGTCLGPVMK